MSNDYRWNNFHLWFPGKTYRFGRKAERSSKLISDLDSVIAEQNFDLQRFNYLTGRMGQYRREAADLATKVVQLGMDSLTPDERQKYAEIDTEPPEYFELDAILEPVVKRMTEMGYTLVDLTR